MVLTFEFDQFNELLYNSHRMCLTNLSEQSPYHRIELGILYIIITYSPWRSERLKRIETHLLIWYKNDPSPIGSHQLLSYHHPIQTIQTISSKMFAKVVRYPTILKYYSWSNIIFFVATLADHHCHLGHRQRRRQARSARRPSSSCCLFSPTSGRSTGLCPSRCLHCRICQRWRLRSGYLAQLAAHWSVLCRLHCRCSVGILCCCHSGCCRCPLCCPSCLRRAIGHQVCAVNRLLVCVVD